MFSLRSKFLATIKSNILQTGLAVLLVFFSSVSAWPTCSLPDSIKTDTTITGTCTLNKDLYIIPGATLTIAPPCTLYIAPLSDEKNLGDDPQRIEILVAGGFRVMGNSGPTGKVVFRSNRLPSGNAGDWFGIERVASTAQIRVNYAELLDGNLSIYSASGLDAIPYIHLDSVSNSRFENWKTHAIANTAEPGPELADTAQTSAWTWDSIVVYGNVFLGRDTAIEFTHDFGLLIDSNHFLNQKSLAVFLDDYTGTISRNYFFASNGIRAMKASGTSIGDSTTIVQNIIKGYYSYAHIEILAAFSPLEGFRVRGNKFVTGERTLSSHYGLLTNIAGAGLTNYKLLAR